MRFTFIILAHLLVIGPTFAGDRNWTFKFQSSFASNDERFIRSYHDNGDASSKLKQEIKSLATNYSNHSERLAGMSEICNGKSEQDIMRMGRVLSERLADIYDYDRIDNGPTASKVVSSADQWNALDDDYRGKASKAGVCRDMTITVSELLLQCGISKNRIHVSGYRTQAGGHQVVQVLGRDGRMYTINWSELNSQNYDPRFNRLGPNIPHTGIQVTRYDPETGRVIDQRLTELGAILMSVTGGVIDDEDYIPELIQLEANYSVLTLGAYQAQTSDGEFIKGVKAAYDQRPLKWLHLKAGLTYAHASNQNLTTGQDWRGDLATKDISRSILFVQLYGAIDFPDIQILKRKNKKLFIDTNFSINAASAAISTKLDGSIAEWNTDTQIKGDITTAIVYVTPKIKSQLGIGLDYGINDKAFNNERDTWIPNNGMTQTPFRRGNYIYGQFVYDNGNLKASANARVYIYSYGSNSQGTIDFFNRKALLGASAGYYLRKDVLGNNYHTVTAGVSKTLKTNNGSQLTIGAYGSVSTDKFSTKPEYRGGINLTYAPSASKPKKKKKTVKKKYRLQRKR